MSSIEPKKINTISRTLILILLVGFPILVISAAAVWGGSGIVLIVLPIYVIILIYSFIFSVAQIFYYKVRNRSTVALFICSLLVSIPLGTLYLMEVASDFQTNKAGKIEKEKINTMYSEFLKNLQSEFSQKQIVDGVFVLEKPEGYVESYASTTSVLVQLESGRLLSVVDVSAGLPDDLKFKKIDNNRTLTDEEQELQKMVLQNLNQKIKGKETTITLAVVGPFSDDSGYAYSRILFENESYYMANLADGQNFMLPIPVHVYLGKQLVDYNFIMNTGNENNIK